MAIKSSRKLTFVIFKIEKPSQLGPNSPLSSEMNYNVGKFKIFFLLNHFFLSLNIVNILQMNIDDEKSQMDLLKVQKHRK